ncbi:MBL fold metallo-hydrolase [Pedobacter aquatilis]|uniref:MBL fold metallo-hydrolase n=1 Tax=Pedobacter aquatilis TaxID=351343 RepID=UPI00292EF28C|nr:MBL fold metallo-hydrolase [Pedobacter aquatilis]
MEGKINASIIDNLIIHTYTSPENGWSVNSHIIELPSQLLVVDAQLLIPYAEEVADYAASLGKPISRLYVTHHHPDHFFGATAFNTSISALTETAEMIEATADLFAGSMHARLGDLVPAKAPRVAQIIQAGTEIFDDIELEFIHLKNAETVDALIIALPNHGILITQDMIYNRIHPYLGDMAFDSWMQDLEHFKSQKKYVHIFPGHGKPGGTELYDLMLGYLAAARRIYQQSTTFTEFITAIKEARPDYYNDALLNLSQRYLFPKKNES